MNETNPLQELIERDQRSLQNKIANGKGLRKKTSHRIKYLYHRKNLILLFSFLLSAFLTYIFTKPHIVEIVSKQGSITMENQIIIVLLSVVFPMIVCGLFLKFLIDDS